MRVLICETNWQVMGLSHALKEAGFLLTRAESEEDFDGYLDHGRQDVLLLPLDISKPGASRRLMDLRDKALGKPILVLSNAGAPEDRAAALLAGADDILPEIVEPDLLATRLRALVLRAYKHAHGTLQAGPATVDVMARAVCVGEAAVRLSPLEYEIFEALALRAGRPLSQERLMDQLYAWEDEPDSKIIRVYLSKIRRKLMAAGAPSGMIETRWGHGYHLVTEDDAIAA